MELKTDWPYLVAGDIILSTSESWIAKSIRFFGKLQTGSAEFSHAAFALDGKHCIEALDRIRINPISRYYKQTVQIWRLPLSPNERDNFHDGMIIRTAGNYGWTKIPLFAMDSVCSSIGRMFGRTKPCVWFTKRAGIFNIQVCSQLGVYGFHKFTDYRLCDVDHKEVTWREVSPDYFADLLHLPHNRAQLLYEQQAT